MSVYRFSFVGPRPDELVDLVGGGASNTAAGADLQFDVTLTDDSRADDLIDTLRVAGFDFVGVNPSGPPGLIIPGAAAQLSVVSCQILARLDEIIWHMERLTEVQAPTIGGDGTLFGRLDVILQLLMLTTEAGSPVSGTA
jgi:hypothetical protein